MENFELMVEAPVSRRRSERLVVVDAIQDHLLVVRFHWIIAKYNEKSWVDSLPLRITLVDIGSG